jgi:hypothetical protein
MDPARPSSGYPVDPCRSSGRRSRTDAPRPAHLEPGNSLRAGSRSRGSRSRRRPARGTSAGRPRAREHLPTEHRAPPGSRDRPPRPGRFQFDARGVQNRDRVGRHGAIGAGRSLVGGVDRRIGSVLAIDRLRGLPPAGRRLGRREAPGALARTRPPGRPGSDACRTGGRQTLRSKVSVATREPTMRMALRSFSSLMPLRVANSSRASQFRRRKCVRSRRVVWCRA